MLSLDPQKKSLGKTCLIIQYSEECTIVWRRLYHQQRISIYDKLNVEDSEEKPVLLETCHWFPWQNLQLWLVWIFKVVSLFYSCHLTLIKIFRVGLFWWFNAVRRTQSYWWDLITRQNFQIWQVLKVQDFKSVLLVRLAVIWSPEKNLLLGLIWWFNIVRRKQLYWRSLITKKNIQIWPDEVSRYS